jgi:DNA-binding MarR family transcriptional regulator
VHSEPSTHHLAAGLARIAVAVQATDGTSAAGLERTLAQQQILLFLNRRADAHPVTELAGELAMTVPVTLAAVDTLVREGLVTMAPSPSFAPSDVRVALTDAGRAQSPELLNWAADLLAELHRLDEGNRRKLLQVVISHIRRLQALDQIPVTKMCVTCRFFDGYAYPGSSQPHHCWLVDSPFGHQQLRLRCPDAVPGEPSPAG